MALPRSQRITSDRDFTAILKEGKTERGSFFFIKTRQRSDKKVNRFGIIVPARVVKSSVKRNAIKRAFQEAFRTVAPEAQGTDIVCFVNRDCSDTLNEVREEFKTILGHYL